MTNEFLKLEVNFFDHAKVVDLGDTALRLHLTAIAYANRLMTDGFIATAIARRLVDADPHGQGWGWDDHVKELLSARLWEEVEGGYRIHDFLDHNTPRAERLRKRAEDRERKARERAEAKRAAQDNRDGPQGIHTDTVDASGRTTSERPRGVRADADEVSLAPARPRTEAETEAEIEAGKVNTVVGIDERSRPVSVDRQVFDFWTAERHKRSDVRFSEARRNVVKAALKAGYTTDDMFDAIRGVALDPWPDRPAHDDLIVVLRLGGRGNRNNLEHFRELWRAGGPPATSGNQPSWLPHAKRRLAAAEGRSP